MEKRHLSEKITGLESIIIQQQNMMETTGYYLQKNEDAKESSEYDIKSILENFEKAKYQGKLPQKALDIFYGA